MLKTIPTFEMAFSSNVFSISVMGARTCKIHQIKLEKMRIPITKWGKYTLKRISGGLYFTNAPEHLRLHADIMILNEIAKTMNSKGINRWIQLHKLIF